MQVRNDVRYFDKELRAVGAQIRELEIRQANLTKAREIFNSPVKRRLKRKRKPVK